MKTWIGVAILVAVAAVLAFGVYMFSQRTTTAVENTDSLIRTINLQDSCTSGLWDDCCALECTNECGNLDLVNNHANNYLCTCWCE